jgi:hypothetical protein
MRRTLPVMFGIGVLAAVASCGGGLPGGGDLPDRPGRKSNVDPNTCGTYASTDIGRKVKAFLVATVALDEAAMKAENTVKDACKAMGAELGMSGLDGDTGKVCKAVAEKLDATLKASVKADAKLDIEYKPAVCTVDASVQASAQAECAGSASAGAGGSSAEGACASSAEITAAIEAKCEPAELEVEFSGDIAVDADALAKAVKAIEVGLPKILEMHGRLVVIQKAAVAWGKAAADLVDAGNDLLEDLGDQVLCVGGQLAAALDMVGQVMGSLEVSVTVSVEVSASAGASI